MEYLCVGNDVTSLALNTLVESMPIVIVKLDDQGNISYLNSFAEQLLDYPEGTLIGQPIATLFDNHEDLSWFRGAVDDKWADDAGRVTRNRRKSRRKRLYLDWRCNRIPTTDPDRVERLFVGLDVTRKKQAERRLRLAHRQFVAQVSHELRTPLQVVMFASDLLQLGTKLSLRQQQYVEVIKHSADVQLAQVNDILDFRTIEAGKIRFEEERFNLHEALGDVCRMLAIAANEKKLKLVLGIHPSVPEFVRGDAKRLCQVVRNLANNAIQYTQEGEAVVQVSLRERTDDRIELFFAISDTGPGIARADINRIFRPFGTLNRKQGGTGLGLSIAKGLVEQMQGKIDVTSQPGRGSTFFFTVWLAREPGPELEDRTWRKDLRGRRVLIVDDNKTTRDVLALILSGWEIEPLEAADSPTALAILSGTRTEGRPVDLILCDMDLPGVDGRMLGGAVAACEIHARTPIVMMTTFGCEVKAKPSAGADVELQLIKPIVPSALARILTTALRLLMPTPGTGSASEASSTTAVAVAEPRPLSILLAEDSSDSQTLLSDFLTRGGHRVVAVGDGASAVQAFSQDAFDIVLLDVELPILHGFQVASAIRRAEQAAGQAATPILALTAHATKGFDRHCLKAGMTHYLAKPINLSVLCDAIERLIPGFIRPTQSAGVAPRLPDLCDDGAVACRMAVVLDRELIFESIGDREALQRWVRDFLALHPETLGRLGEAVARRDPEKLYVEAHTLLGALQRLFWQPAVDLADQLVTMGKEEQLDETPFVYAEFAREFTRLAIAAAQFVEVSKL